MFMCDTFDRSVQMVSAECIPWILLNDDDYIVDYIILLNDELDFLLGWTTWS